MAPEWLPHWLKYILWWIDDEQTLLTGAAALFIGWKTVEHLKRQISASADQSREALNQQKDFEEDRLIRKRRAARSVLPIALAEIGDYVDRCLQTLKVIEVAIDNESLPADCEIPKFPTGLIASFKEAIEAADVEDAKKLAALVASLQVYQSRLGSFVANASAPDASTRMGRYVLGVRSPYFDTLALLKHADRAYGYARGKAEHIAEFKDADDAIGTLHVRFLIFNDELDADVRRKWPPTFHDYADGIDNW